MRLKGLGVSFEKRMCGQQTLLRHLYERGRQEANCHLLLRCDNCSLAGSLPSPKDQKNKCGYFCPPTKLVQGGEAAAQRKGKKPSPRSCLNTGPRLNTAAPVKGTDRWVSQRESKYHGICGQPSPDKLGKLSCWNPVNCEEKISPGEG